MTDRGQLPFSFGHRPALSDEDFLVAPCNQEAVAWLDRWPRWPAPVLVLHGPPGCGKTHLVRVFMAHSGARPLTPDELTGNDPAALFAEAPACIIEDAGGLVGGGAEEALLHLHNTAGETGRQMLLTARQAPGRWPTVLPDLRSRLNAAMAVGIGPPDDDLITAVLVKLFADRQLGVDDALIGYMVKRTERSFGAVHQLVAAIDTAALAERRKITVRLVGEVLARMDRPEEKEIKRP